MKLESIEYDQWGGCQAQTKEVGRGRGKKNTPARSHCWFRKLRSWANGVADCCGMALNVIKAFSFSFRIGLPQVKFKIEQDCCSHRNVENVVASLALKKNL